MYSISSLATAPERQGRGYASTLVRLVTDQVRDWPWNDALVLIGVSTPSGGEGRPRRVAWLKQHRREYGLLQLFGVQDGGYILCRR